MKPKRKIAEWVWDLWCLCSVIGVWPRFIEPNLLSISHQKSPLPCLSRALSGMRLVQFSDLHWCPHLSSFLLEQLTQKINQLQPDFLFFTGDFLCRSRLEDKEKLRQFLCGLKAKRGCFAVLGNHDYAQFVTVKENGDYGLEQKSSASDIVKGFRRLFKSCPLSRHLTEEVSQIGLHNELIELLQQTPFKLLRNETVQISCTEGPVNISGLGEYIAGDLGIQQTFSQYDQRYPGIILAHNPDAVEALQHYPGDLILSGHTHGGQINLPWMWKRFTRIEHLELKKGLKRYGNKWIYINRGIGSVLKFRWFALPELTVFSF
jgi:uncharacterized protein